MSMDFDVFRQKTQFINDIDAILRYLPEPLAVVGAWAAKSNLYQVVVDGMNEA